MRKRRMQKNYEEQSYVWWESNHSLRYNVFLITYTTQRILKKAVTGDFRQTCPVIRRGTPNQIIDASIKSSSLWNHFTIYELHQPIRQSNDPTFAKFLDDIGDGIMTNVPLNMFITVSSAEQLIDSVFPNILLSQPINCVTRSILAPTNAQVNMYNTEILRRCDGREQTYFASDSLEEAENAGIPPCDSILDYVACHTPDGMPAYSLTIKQGCVYRLLRNFSVDNGLVKNSRLLITNLGRRIITTRLLQNNRVGEEDILIPRIPFTTILKSRHQLKRRQFPLTAAYATTFNSCQGLTLDRIGVDLTRPVFSHGQLYTALSRVRRANDIIIRSVTNETINVTYEKILR